MKQLLILLLFSIWALTTQAQDLYQGIPRDSASGKITYTGVVQVPGVSKDELYNRAREWVAMTFKSASDVLQMDDRAAGKIIAKGNYSKQYVYLTSGVRNYFYHTIKLELKDGRFRYTISDFYVEGGSKLIGVSREMEEQIRVASKNPGSGVKSGNPKGLYRYFLDGVREPGEQEVSSLKAALTKQGTAEKDF